MTVLKDDSKMPLGKLHKDKPMQDVPAPYLLWLYDQIKPSAPNKRSLSQKHVLKYVEDNMEVLKKQNSESYKPYIK